MSPSQRASLRACALPPFAAIALAVTLSVAPNQASAHVTLDSPNGGESLTVDSTFVIEWRPDPGHDTIDWDLWYSTESAEGPWTVIALDLPVGNPDTGSIHLFDWTVPNEPGEAWVRVQQDNEVEQDWDDVSDASFEIVAAGLAGDFDGSGVVDAADYTVWRDGLGSTFIASDYLTWHNNYGAALATNSAAPVPEPTAMAILLAVVATCPLRRRQEK